MRIIAGSLGGRRLKTPAGSHTRPTSDRVREAIFSILGPPRPQTRVLDLFAGAGSLGLEALSRGAASVDFIDSNSASVRVLRENITSLGVAASSRIHQSDVVRYLPRLSGQFDWIFLDPPYRAALAEQTLGLLGTGAVLSDDAIVLAEHDRRNEPASRHGCLIRTDQRRYGDTTISFYRRSGDE